MERKKKFLYKWDQKGINYFLYHPNWHFPNCRLFVLVNMTAFSLDFMFFCRCLITTWSWDPVAYFLKYDNVVWFLMLCFSTIHNYSDISKKKNTIILLITNPWWECIWYLFFSKSCFSKPLLSIHQKLGNTWEKSS